MAQCPVIGEGASCISDLSAGSEQARKCGYSLRLSPHPLYLALPPPQPTRPFPEQQRSATLLLFPVCHTGDTSGREKERGEEGRPRERARLEENKQLHFAAGYGVLGRLILQREDRCDPKRDLDGQVR